MKQIYKNRNRILAGVLISYATYIIVVSVIFFPPPKPLTVPVYFITSTESELEIVNSTEPNSCLKTLLYDENFKFLRESDVNVVLELPDLLIDLDEVVIESKESNVLFKLESPVDMSAKIVRHQIDEQFSGAENMIALKSLIGVIDLETHNSEHRVDRRYQQLNDNLNYIKHNFGGVGTIINNMDTNDLENYCHIILEALTDPDH